MEVIHTMEDGLTRPNVYRNMKLPPSTVSTIKRNADEIELSIQHVMKVCATQVRHIFFVNFAKQMEKLLVLWVEDLNKKSFR
jgi:hypothetical protein